MLEEEALAALISLCNITGDSCHRAAPCTTCTIYMTYMREREEKESDV